MLPDGRLNPYALASCLYEMLDKGICPPSIAEAQTVLEADDRFVEAMNRLYPDTRGQEQHLGLDTAERGAMLEILAWNFADNSWPVIGDSLETQRNFLDKMQNGLGRDKCVWSNTPTIK